MVAPSSTARRNRPTLACAATQFDNLVDGLPADQGALGVRRRIVVRFAYEWRDHEDAWFRSHRNEQWEFETHGYKARREASINDVPIRANERLFLWPAGSRPAGGPGLCNLDL